MKGFLSFLGITLITIAFGSILFSFYGNPLEDLKSQERQLAYQEMRANQSAQADRNALTALSTQNDEVSIYAEEGLSCTRLSFDQ